MSPSRRGMLILALIAPLGRLAQAQKRLRRIGFLGDGTRAERWDITLEPLREGLRALGYVEGRDIVIEERWSDGAGERLAPLVRELIGAEVDVLVLHGVRATKAAQAVTKTVPVVVAVIPDPVANGVVKSFSRPGGNVTGLSDQVLDFVEKEIQLFREIVPGLKRVAILWNEANPGARLTFEQTREAVKKSGLQFTVHVATTPAELEGAFDGLAAQQPDGLVLVHDLFMINNRMRIAQLALQHRLPSICAATPFVPAGGLVAYAVSYEDQFRRSASYVDKILKGAKPGDLPFQQPTQLELLINLKTAKALGLAIPMPVLARADRIIQ